MDASLSVRNHFSHPRAQVAVHREMEQATIGPHRHEFVEIVFVLSGRGFHVTGEIRHEVGAGDVLVINHRRSHGYESTSRLHLVNILVRDDALREARRELGALAGFHALFTLEPARWRRRDFTARLRLTPAELRQVSGWIECLEKESGRDGEGSRFLARNWLMLIVGFLARCSARRPQGSEQPDRRLADLLARIDAGPEPARSVEEMARESAMSVRTFLRRFREATGHSPVDYLLRARIRQAAHLLDHGDRRLTVTEIAFRCGFGDSNYFTRQFRRIMGLSPRAYRRVSGAEVIDCPK